MRITTIMLLAGLAVACSDTSGPQQFQPQEKTYALRLTTCVGCPEDTTPPLALIWKDGVEARIAVEHVTTVGADGSFLFLSAGQSSLLQALPETTFKFSKLSSGAYSGSVVYGEGRITVALVEGGCSFSLFWPGVAPGGGACVVE